MVATPDYENNLQGTVTQTSTATNLAITGQGFFAVSQATSETNGNATFSPQQFYTRAGDFQMNKDGYLVNSAGDFLNGWPVDAQRRGQPEFAGSDPGHPDLYSPIPPGNYAVRQPASDAATGTGTAASPMHPRSMCMTTLGTSTP